MHKDFESKYFVTKLNLSTVFLEPVLEFKWLILVSNKVAKNILDLNEEDKYVFWTEINVMSKIINKIYQPDQINIAMLGNKTQYLHAHIIARFTNDLAWPNPTFGYQTTLESVVNLEKIKEKILHELKNF